jgi:nucleoside-diphosphate-sugar epimerase
MILVTGAAGLFGHPLAKRLAAAGRRVVATDLRAPDEPLDCRFVAADLRDAGAIAQIIEREKITRVIHAGAISGRMVAPTEPHRIMSVNVTGTLEIAEACRAAGIERLIVLSSIGVYGDQPTLDPVPETAQLLGVDAYSASKIAMESVLKGYRQDFGLPATVIRASSTFGPGRRTPCFIRGMLEAHRAGRPAQASDDGICRRQFLFVEDAVRAVCLALDAELPLDFAYNVTGGTWLTEAEVAAAAMRAVPSLRVEIGTVPPLCLDGRMGPLSLDRIGRDLGYRPEVSLEEGIARYAAFLGAGAA